MYLNNLKAKLSITKLVENNVFEGMMYQCLNIVSKQFKYHLQNVFIILKVK